MRKSRTLELKGLLCFAHKKRVYATKKTAITVANQSKAYTGKELAVYKCQECKKWHLTKERQHDLRS